MPKIEDALKYAKSLGLDHLVWIEDGNDLDEETEHVLMIYWNSGMFGLEFGMHMAGNNFMSADDLGWCGPVRHVVISAKIEIG